MIVVSLLGLGVFLLDHLGLVHMGGRVYDPDSGRFLSADLFVQSPYNTQSYNRYSYVFNNPLRNTDPSGYLSREDEAKKAPEEVLVLGHRISQQSNSLNMSLGFMSLFSSANSSFGGLPSGMISGFGITSKMDRYIGKLGVRARNGDIGAMQALQNIRKQQKALQKKLRTGGLNGEGLSLGAQEGSSDFNWIPPSLPQGVVDFAAGFGDMASFGLSKYIRGLYDIGSVDILSSEYSEGLMSGFAGTVGAGAGIGTALNIGIRALGGAKNLYHFTSAANAAGIRSSGVINASSGGLRSLYGQGVYASAVRSSGYARYQGAISVDAVFTVSGSRALATPFPGTFRIPGSVGIK